MNDERKILIEHRQQKAQEALKDAEILLSNGRLFSTVNRIYYALFYEVIALLLTRDLSSAKHSGVRALFNEHFVKTGDVPVDIGKFYARMFEFRQKGDYGDFIDFDTSKVTEWLEETKNCITIIDQVIEKSFSE